MPGQSPRISLTLEAARRLAVTKQHLAGKLSNRPSSGRILDVMRDLGYIQLDPTNAVAPSHLIVLWSRLGSFEKSELDRLLWKERKLFEYWAHAASIVLMEDYPLYRLRMTTYAQTDSTWHKRVRRWMGENAGLKRYVLRELKLRGQLLSRQFEDESRVGWKSSGWTGGRNVSRMLDFLSEQGKIMVAGRQGVQKLWDLSERCLPSWTPKKEMSADEVEYEGAQRSLRALGVANAYQIGFHFLSGRYPNLKNTLERLKVESKIFPVEIIDGAVGKGECYVHAKDLVILEALNRGDWEPRTTLLSPFDNLIIDRARTNSLFNFEFKLETYTRRAERRYGYYVLPILYGERLIGRIDPIMDRRNERLVVNAVHAEADAPRKKEASKRIANVVLRLAEFLGAREVVYSKRVPSFWKSSLR